MAVKGKYRRGKTNRRKSSSRRRHTRRRTYRGRRVCQLGGNYEKDVTTQTFLNFPMKESNKVVTSVPGRGVMSVSAYKRLMEDEERNGFDFYD
jgi:hypothetical protein